MYTIYLNLSKVAHGQEQLSSSYNRKTKAQCVKNPPTVCGEEGPSERWRVNEGD
jgi:hypothetical protein